MPITKSCVSRYVCRYIAIPSSNPFSNSNHVCPGPTQMQMPIKLIAPEAAQGWLRLVHTCQRIFVSFSVSLCNASWMISITCSLTLLWFNPCISCCKAIMLFQINSYITEEWWLCNFNSIMPEHFEYNCMGYYIHILKLMWGSKALKKMEIYWCVSMRCPLLDTIQC